MSAAAIITDTIRNIISYFKISCSYFKRRNPFMASMIGFLTDLYNLLNLKKTLKAMKYQVQLHYYRLQQMDKLINECNPHNTKGGFHINKYR